MPGILPMKMIRVGSNSQSRIAQACDRCRSKKIRCDGVRPCCTQCANVGFECKTSDKLSRRAFPRGYTESLEDRVRGLEAEVRELKDLLDEKDEKIDMLSRIHNFSPSRKCSASLSPSNAEEAKVEVESTKEDVIHVEIPAPVQPRAVSTGSSTTAAFVEAFDHRLQQTGRPTPNISIKALSAPKPSTRGTSNGASRIPPRILSDQFINLFFQEWQPLLPILHRPTFLRVYEQYASGNETGNWQHNKYAVAQLFLIFEIASLSTISRNKHAGPSYETYWKKALWSISSSTSIATLQCHILAQLCYLLRGEHSHMTRHRGIAVGMSHELGLHQGYKYHSLNTLEAETSKRVFWCQYVLDKFISATTGTPMLIRDTDITTDYPADVDDENVTTQGFSPALPGELTKISSALALFRSARILSKTLETIYPAQATYQLSLSKLHALSDELDQWSEDLPEHLRLRFCNDKPSTNIISCRSPILSVTYFYIRSLIHRPLLVYGSESSSSAAMIALSAAGKHMLQVLDLLGERHMNYTFPFNRTELLILAGFSILWQSIDLDQDSKMVKDNQKSLSGVMSILSRENQLSAVEFQKIAVGLMTSHGRRKSSSPQADSNNAITKRTGSMTALDGKSKNQKKPTQAISPRLSSSKTKAQPEESSRRATIPEIGINYATSSGRAGSTISLSSTHSEPNASLNTPSLNQLTLSTTLGSSPGINLDYFDIGDDNIHNETHSSTSSSTMLPPKKPLDHPSLADTNWEHLLSSLDTTDAANSDIFAEFPLGPHHDLGAIGSDWAADTTWGLPAIDFAAKAPVPQSLLSFSEESMTSGDEFVLSAPGSTNGSTSTNESTNRRDLYKGISIPVDDEFDFHEIEV